MTRVDIGTGDLLRAQNGRRSKDFRVQPKKKIENQQHDATDKIRAGDRCSRNIVILIHFPKQGMKPPLSPTTRIEETSSCQGRGNQDSKFSYILRSRCTEHVSVRKCSYTWIFVSLESAEDHGYKQSGTTKAEEGNDQHICKATAAAAGMLFYRFFWRTFGSICLNSGMDRGKSRLLPVMFACMCASKLLFRALYISL